MKTKLYNLKKYRSLTAEIHQAKSLLSRCLLCPWKCGTNRMEGEMGKCETIAKSRYFDGVIHWGDEMALTPNYAISFNGCNLRCGYCITARNSYFGWRGEAFSVEDFALRIQKMFSQGIPRVHFLGGEPAIHLLTLLELIQCVPPEMEIILNTNLYCSRELLDLISPLVDTFLVDLKYGQNHCAEKLSGVSAYFETLSENLSSVPVDKIILRHLLLPGHLECCTLPVIDWIGQTLPEVRFSLREQFVSPSPVPTPGLSSRFVHPDEIREAKKRALERRLSLVQ